MTDPIVYLTEADVRRLLDPQALRTALSAAFVSYSTGDASVPARIAAHSGHGLLAAMPGYVAGVGLAIKAVTLFPGNHGTDVPSHQGIIVVFDPETGTPLAVMDAASVTAIRTAASAALAADLLARTDAEVLTIIGGGVQGHEHLTAFGALRPWSEIRVASRSSSSAEALAQRDPRALVADSFEAAVRGADVVALCTDAGEPVIEAEWVGDGTHFSSVGHLNESPPVLYRRGPVFVEWRGCVSNPPPAGAGELQGLDPATVTELGELIIGRRPGRAAADQVTLYKSTGHALEDVAASLVVLDRALAEGVGLRLPR